MNLKNTYIVGPRTVADGHSPPGHSSFTVHETRNDALDEAERRLGTHGRYDGVIIYQAITLVQRTAPPIRIRQIDDEGEVSS